MRYFIAGFGKFGRLALERLTAAPAPPEITIVEPRARVRPADLDSSITWVAEDAVAFLKEARGLLPNDMILPMVPFHLAAAYALAVVPGLTAAPMPAEISVAVPNYFQLDLSNGCCSVADFLCPDDCPEGDLCTITGQPRSPLSDRLRAMRVEGFKIIVLRSLQILPGIGGIEFAALQDFTSRLREGKYLLATSCKCHAALTAVEKALI